MEDAFLVFGGVPAEVLLDNARALVEDHDAHSREVRFNPRLHAFVRYWGFQPRACAPYRARTKGKDERGVGYVKRNAVAGRRFETWAAFEAHLRQWVREVADRRVHGTTGEPPIVRFQREAGALKPLCDPFGHSLGARKRAVSPQQSTWRTRDVGTSLTYGVGCPPGPRVIAFFNRISV